MKQRIDKLPDESNEAYCRRVARTLDKDELIFRFISHLAETPPKNKPLWSKVGYALGHGSGVSSEIIEEYYTSRRNICDCGYHINDCHCD